MSASTNIKIPNILNAFDNLTTFRGKSSADIGYIFNSLLRENHDLAIRFLLYSRDILQGAGERNFFRISVLLLSHYSKIEGIINKIPEIGRFDDLLIDWKTKEAMQYAVARYVKGLRNPNEVSLAAKWCPRKGIWANRIAKAMGYSGNPKGFRKFLVANSKVVEQKMCANKWDEINYNHVPSIAHNNYRKAFEKHSPDSYKDYVESLVDGTAKINSKAIPTYSLAASVDKLEDNKDLLKSLDIQFNSIPYFLKGLKVLPIVDVSPSMDSISFGNISCKQIAMSLGAHIAYNQSGMLHNSIMTFSEKPKLLDYKGKTFSEIVKNLKNQSWGMSTDLVGSMDGLFSFCKKSNVKEEDLPDVIIVFSDMEMNSGLSIKGGTKSTIFSKIKDVAKQYNYKKIPKIIFWNLNGRNQLRNNSLPKIADNKDVNALLISGFSPVVLAYVEKIISFNGLFTTENILNEILSSERYNYK